MLKNTIISLKIHFNDRINYFHGVEKYLYVNVLDVIIMLLLFQYTIMSH